MELLLHTFITVFNEQNTPPKNGSANLEKIIRLTNLLKNNFLKRIIAGVD